MERISLRSNQTRAAQRPPLFISLARSALFADLLHKYPRKVVRKPVRNAPADQASSRPAQVSKASAPSPAANRTPESKPAARPVEPAPRDLSFRRPPNGRPGTNGANGHASPSQIFRSSAITGAPVTRQTTRPAPPVQIPFEVHTPYRASRDQEPAPKPVEPTSQPHTKADSKPDARVESVPRSPMPAVPVRPAAPQRKAVPSLAGFLRQHPELPAHTALLGVCDDGLPVLLDLYDAAPGALISMGDERELHLELLRTAVASMVTRNTPRSVQFVVLTCDAPAWQEWIVEKGFDRYCLAVEDADSELVREWVLRLADWTEQRRLGQRSGPPVLLVMDTLSFLPRMSYDVRLNFEWMVREGPQAQIWPLAAISTELAKVLHSRRMLRAFQTRILGAAENPSVYSELAGLSPTSVEDFREPGAFAVQVGENWLRFRLFGSR